MLDSDDDEDSLLRAVTTQNARAILRARQRAEDELLRARDALELKTQELAHSLAMMRATLEASTDGILVTDERGDVTDFNEKYVAMWRLPREVLASRKHGDIVAAIARQFEDPQAFVARVDAIYATFPEESFDGLELADGRVFERISRLQVVDGRNVGRVWSVRDITETRRAEEALRDETRTLEVLNETGKALASKLDLQPILQAAIDAATELSGATFGVFVYHAAGATGEVAMLRAVAGALPDGIGKFLDPRATPLFGGDPRLQSRLAVPVASRSGDVVGGLVFGHPEPGVFTERAERLVVGVAAQAAVAIDNARLYEAAQRAAEERKHLLERERLARTEAERASAMKDEFLATLSHELRTPLTAILGWSRMLGMPTMADAERRRAVEVIDRNARTQLQLVEDLLDMSRIISGKLNLDVQPVPPAAIVEAALETVRPAADAKGIHLSALLDPAAGPVAGDPTRLQQVVWNLLSNAIKFTGKGGRVQVLLQRIASHVEISVTDSGLGITSEFLPYVFDRFRQADGSTTRKAGGLGLGLAVVKHLVELHGGSVRATSPGLGGGATFTVELPLLAVRGDLAIDPLRPRLATLEFKRSDLTGIKVLAVDDDADGRDLIKHILVECGAEVVTVGTAAEALLAVEGTRPHVLISDIGMPEVDGYELLRAVRGLGQSRGGGLPAIALTAFARSEDRTRALRAGFLVHVAKPVEPSELVATVASVVGRTGDPALESGDR